MILHADIGRAIVGQIGLELPRDFGVRLVGEDLGLWIQQFEIQAAEADIGAAVHDERGGCLGVESVCLVHKNVSELINETLPIHNAQVIVQARDASRRVTVVVKSLLEGQKLQLDDVVRDGKHVDFPFNAEQRAVRAPRPLRRAGAAH